MKRIYLSGPISGMPNENRPAFEAAANAMRGAGLDVVTPFEINPTPGTWAECMRKDIAVMLTQCDAVVLLDGWEKSGGAVGEASIANWLGMPISAMRNGIVDEITPRQRAAFLFRLPAPGELRRAWHEQH